METWKLLLITLLSAVLLGCIIGVAVGKHQIKRGRGDYKPLLTPKERIIYAACILVGAGCILFGVFYTPPATQVDGGGGAMLIGPDGEAIEGVEGFADDLIQGEADAGQDAMEEHAVDEDAAAVEEDAVVQANPGAGTARAATDNAMVYIPVG